MPQNALECTSEHLKLPNFLGKHTTRPLYGKAALGCPRPPSTAIFSTLANMFAPPKYKSYVYNPDRCSITCLFQKVAGPDHRILITRALIAFWIEISNCQSHSRKHNLRLQHRKFLATSAR